MYSCLYRLHNLYIKLLMFYDILGFIDGPRPDANGTADDTQ